MQMALAVVQGDLDLLAGEWTQLAQDEGAQVTVEFETQPLDDPTLTEQQLGTDLQAGIRTGREWRAIRGLPPYGDWRDDARVTGQINQAVQILSDPNGDGNYADGFDRRSYFALFAREYAELYGKATLTDIGVTTLASQAYRFPISTGSDAIKVVASDVTVAADAPYTQISVRYFDQAFSRDVDSASERDFGIVIDVGTHNQSAHAHS